MRIINLFKMNNTNRHDERIANMIFATVYPHYVAKVEKKGLVALGDYVRNRRLNNL